MKQKSIISMLTIALLTLMTACQNQPFDEQYTASHQKCLPYYQNADRRPPQERALPSGFHRIGDASANESHNFSCTNKPMTVKMAAVF